MSDFSQLKQSNWGEIGHGRGKYSMQWLPRKLAIAGRRRRSVKQRNREKEEQPEFNDELNFGRISVFQAFRRLHL